MKETGINFETIMTTAATHLKVLFASGNEEVVRQYLVSDHFEIDELLTWLQANDASLLSPMMLLFNQAKDAEGRNPSQSTASVSIVAEIQTIKTLLSSDPVEGMKRASMYVKTMKFDQQVFVGWVASNEQSFLSQLMDIFAYSFRGDDSSTHQSVSQEPVTIVIKPHLAPNQEKWVQEVLISQCSESLKEAETFILKRIDGKTGVNKCVDLINNLKDIIDNSATVYGQLDSFNATEYQERIAQLNTKLRELLTSLAARYNELESDIAAKKAAPENSSGKRQLSPDKQKEIETCNSKPTIVTPTEEERCELWKEEYYLKDFERELQTLDSKVTYNDMYAFLQERLMKLVRIINFEGTKFIAFKPFKGKRPIMKPYSTFKRDYGSGFKGYLLECTHYKDDGNPYTKKHWAFEIAEMEPTLAYYDFEWMPYSPFELDPLFGKDAYNPFPGFAVNPVPLGEVDMAKITPVLNHIWFCWADQNEEVFWYILGWLHMFFKYPRMQLPMLTIHGEEGAGKTIIINNLLVNLILGRELNSPIGTLENASANFNGYLGDNLLVTVGELKSKGKSDRSLSTMMDELKEKISDSYLMIHKKGVDRYSAKNYNKWIGTTNYEFVMRLKRGNRKHYSIMANDLYKGDSKYFVALAAACDDPEVASHFFTFCYELPDLENPEQFPQTPFMDKIYDMSMSTPESYFHEIKDGETFVYMSESCAKENLRKYPKSSSWFVSKDQIYKSYVGWCKDRGYNRFMSTSDTFWTESKPDWATARPSNWNDGPTQRPRGFMVPKESLVVSCQGTIGLVDKPAISYNGNNTLKSYLTADTDTTEELSF
jgi:hypothetical protein